MTIFFIVSCFFVTVSIAYGEQDNEFVLLNNPSFEQVDAIRKDAPAGWVKHPPQSPGVWASDVSRDGKSSVRIDGSDEKGCSWMQEERFAATPGQQWRLEGWCRTEDGWGDNQLRIAWYDAKGKWLQTDRSESVNGTREWTRLTLEAVTPERASSGRVMVGRRYATANGVSWFDDLSLELTGGGMNRDEGLPGVEIDGSVPRLQPLTWEVSRPSPSTEPSVSESQWSVPDGSDSWEVIGARTLKLSPEGWPRLSLPTAAGNGWITCEAFPITAGKNYEAEGLLTYKDALGASALGIAWVSADGRIISRVYSQPVNGTGKGELISVTGRAPLNAHTARLVFVSRTETGEVFGAGECICHDISIREIPSGKAVHQSLLTNGSLEKEQADGDPDGWHRLSATQAEMGRLTTHPLFVGKAAVFIKDSHGDSAGWSSERFKIQENERYVYRFHVRLENAYHVYAGIEWYANDGKSLALTVAGPMGGVLPWSLASMEAEAPVGAVSARVFVVQAKSSGRAVFDDFSFNPVATAVGVARPIEVPAIAPPSSDEIIVVQKPDTVDLYMKGSSPESNRWLKYRMQNRPNEQKRSDVWRWNEVWEVERTGPYTFKSLERISTNGEIEMAVKQKGKSDFMGGAIHGNEMKVSAEMLVDGLPRSLGQSGDFTAKRVDFRQSSQLLEVDRQTAHCLAHAEREWKFENGEVTISQQIRWEEPVELVDTYLAMLPLERTRGGRSISRYGARSPGLRVEMLDESGFAATYSDSACALAWGDTGYEAEVEVVQGWDKPGREFNFSPAAIYNKFYFDFTGKNYRVEAEETMASRVRFRLNTTN